MTVSRIDSIPESCWFDFDETACGAGDFEVAYDSELIGYLINIRGNSAGAFVDAGQAIGKRRC